MKFKKVFILLMLCSILFIFTGCAKSSPEDVKLANKQSILHYAKSNFGAAEYVSQENKEDSITYTLKDKEYGFTYEITSYVYDDYYMGYYDEEKTSTFDENLQKYVLTELDEYIKTGAKENDITLIESPYPIATFQTTENTNNDKAADFLVELGGEISSFERNKCFELYHIKLIDENEQVIGYYYFDKDFFEFSESPEYSITPHEER